MKSKGNGQCYRTTIIDTLLTVKPKLIELCGKLLFQTDKKDSVPGDQKSIIKNIENNIPSDEQLKKYTDYINKLSEDSYTLIYDYQILGADYSDMMYYNAMRITNYTQKPEILQNLKNVDRKEILTNIIDNVGAMNDLFGDIPFATKGTLQVKVMEISKRIETGVLKYEKFLRSSFDKILKIIKNAPRLPKDCILLSGVKFSYTANDWAETVVNKNFVMNFSEYSSKFENMQSGDILELKSMVSTTFYPFTALLFANNYCCIFRIRIPKGTPCLYLGCTNPMYPEEFELLLPPARYLLNGIFRVVKSPKGYLSQTVYDFTYIGQL